MHRVLLLLHFVSAETEAKHSAFFMFYHYNVKEFSKVFNILIFLILKDSNLFKLVYNVNVFVKSLLLTKPFCTCILTKHSFTHSTIYQRNTCTF